MEIQIRKIKNDKNTKAREIITNDVKNVMGITLVEGRHN